MVDDVMQLVLLVQQRELKKQGVMGRVDIITGH
jgi:hypothetical protein